MQTVGQKEPVVSDFLTSQAITSPQPDLNSWSACKKWSFNTHAHISYVSLSADGQKVLVGTSSERGPNQARIRLMNFKGKTLWSRMLAQPVKAQTISKKGDLLAVNTYNDTLLLYNSSRRLLWKKSHLGRPGFSSDRQLVFFNDDDADPKTAFITYGLKGNSIFTFKTIGEMIDAVFSNDRNYIVVLEKKGQAYLSDIVGKKRIPVRYEGEAISAGAEGSLENSKFAILSTKNGAQILSFYERANLIWSLPLDFHYESIHIHNNLIYLYGNVSKSQVVSAFSTQTKTKVWTIGYKTPANYSSPSYISKSIFSILLDSGKEPGTLHLYGITQDGKTKFDIPIHSDEGVYSFDVDGHYAVIGYGPSHSGVVTLYDLSCGRDEDDF
ncbi:MAG: hypothetical protein AB7F43_03700 [Bacteriovoracia bacterium]